MAKNPTKVDTSVRVPKAVEDARARAEELQKAQQAALRGEQPDPENPDAPNASETHDEPAADEPLDTGNVTPAPTESQSQSQSQPQSQPQPQPSPQTQPQPSPQTQPSEDEASWEHRYKSLKGRFDGLQNQNNELASAITHMQRTLLEMQDAQEARPAATEDPPAALPPLITPQEVSDYGEDFLDLVARQARVAVAAEIDKLRADLGSLKTTVGAVDTNVRQTARERLYTTLSAGIENWREINNSSEFKQWLGEADAFSGVRRQDLLNTAFNANDAKRVTAIFQGFLGQQAATAPQPGPTPPPSTGGKRALKDFAAPGRAKAPAAPTAPDEKPIITTGQIAQFYNDVANGKYAGRDEQRIADHAAIFAAQREGRIVNG